MGPAWTWRDLGEVAVRAVCSSGRADKSSEREGSWLHISVRQGPSFTSHFRAPYSQLSEEPLSRASRKVSCPRPSGVLQFPHFVHHEGTENTLRVEEEGLCMRGGLAR